LDRGKKKQRKRGEMLAKEDPIAGQWCWFSPQNRNPIWAGAQNIVLQIGSARHRKGRKGERQERWGREQKIKEREKGD